MNLKRHYDSSIRLIILELSLAMLGLALAMPAEAGGRSEVSVSTRAVLINSSPQLTNTAPSPVLSDEARSHLSGAADSAYFGKWRSNPDMRSQYASEHENGGANANGVVGAVLPLIKTLPTVNNRALDTTFAFTESETTVAQPMANDIVVAYNSSADFWSGGSYSGYAYSLNGGKTFTEVAGGLPLLSAPNGDTVWPAGDPSLAADGQGNVFYSSIAEDFNNGDSYATVFESNDGGQTFNPFELITAASGNVLDKPLTTVDTNPASPYRGNVYTAVTSFSSGVISPIYVCTMPAKTCVPIVQEAASGAMPAVDANGNLYVAWEQFTTGGGATPIDALYFSKSTDGGQTFSAPSQITNVSPIEDPGTSDFICNRPALKGGIRVNDFPSIAIDTGAKSKNKGAIYVVWNDQRNGDPDIFIAKSTDGGTSWSNPLTVNKNGAHTDQFFPWVTVLPSGKLGVTYYDRSRDQNNWYVDFDLAVSINGGTTWTQSFLTQRPFPVVVNVDPFVATCYMADYNQIGNNGLNLLMAWGDNSNGNPDVRFVKK